jgi:hypothetical protein
MARTLLTPIVLGRDGAALATTSADLANGNAFRMPQTAVPEVLCSFFCVTGGTVTLRANATLDFDLAVPDRVLSLPPATVYLWICQGSPYIQSDGAVWLDCSATTSVALYVI